LHQRLDRWQERRELVVAGLLDLQPALIALQEVAVGLRQAKWLRAQLNMRISGSSTKPYNLVQRRGRHPVWGRVEGVAVLTTMPVISADSTNLGHDGRVALRINTVLPNGAPLDFVSLQLSPVADAHETREEQIMAGLGWINSPGAVVNQIIAGSFEDTPDQLAIRRMKHFYRYRSAFEVAMGREPAATYSTALIKPTSVSGACLDYIFMSTSFAGVDAVGLIGTDSAENDDALYASDHVGVWADIRP
jgi:endonuclease/exonuclease/phosphatase family metal-dependent hydrolase